jgi:hypothetical protein
MFCSKLVAREMSASALAIALLGSAAEVFHVVVTSTNIASSMQKADRQ